MEPCATAFRWENEVLEVTGVEASLKGGAAFEWF